MLILVRCKNVLDPTCSVLSKYSKKFQTTAIHVLQGIRHGNPPGLYFHALLLFYFKLAVHVQGLDH